MIKGPTRLVVEPEIESTAIRIDFSKSVILLTITTGVFVTRNGKDRGVSMNYKISITFGYNCVGGGFVFNR